MSAQAGTPPTAAQGEGVNGEPLNLLFIQYAGAAALTPKPGQGGAYTLTLSQVAASTLWFSDRPDRYVGTVPMARFFHELGMSFQQTPPNAALVVEQTPTQPPANASPVEKRDFQPDVDDVYVVELRNPAYDVTAATLTYDVQILGESTTDMKFREAPQHPPASAQQLGAARIVLDDFICGEYDIICCNGCNKVADLGKHCFHWSVKDGGCEPCAAGHYASYTQTCNTTYASVCPGGKCFANRALDGCC